MTSVVVLRVPSCLVGETIQSKFLARVPKEKLLQCG